MSLFHAIYGEGSGPVPPTPEDLSPVLLWTNTSTSAFPAQTINLDLSEYEGVLVEIKDAPTSNDICDRVYIKKSDSTVTFFGGGGFNRASTSPMSRLISINDNGVVFGKAMQGNTEATDVATPYKIYGIKKYVVEPVEGETLWSNNAPTSVFAAQTVNVTLPLHFKIVWKVSTTDATEIETEYHTNIGGSGIAYGASTNQIYIRKYGLSSTGITFEDTYIIGSGADNYRNIPYKIIALD